LTAKLLVHNDHPMPNILPVNPEAPHMDLLIAQMLGSERPFTALKKAGVACLEMGSASSGGKLVWLAPPKVLRLLGD
jgi:phosphohistidine phosphatase SixA